MPCIFVVLLNIYITIGANIITWAVQVLIDRGTSLLQEPLACCAPRPRPDPHHQPCHHNTYPPLPGRLTPGSCIYHCIIQLDWQVYTLTLVRNIDISSPEARQKMKGKSRMDKGIKPWKAKDKTTALGSREHTSSVALLINGVLPGCEGNNPTMGRYIELLWQLVYVLDE